MRSLNDKQRSLLHWLAVQPGASTTCMRLDGLNPHSLNALLRRGLVTVYAIAGEERFVATQKGQRAARKNIPAVVMRQISEKGEKDGGC
jgi:hypothetical protein